MLHAISSYLQSGIKSLFGTQSVKDYEPNVACLKIGLNKFYDVGCRPIELAERAFKVLPQTCNTTNVGNYCDIGSASSYQQFIGINDGIMCDVTSISSKDQCLDETLKALVSSYDGPSFPSNGGVDRVEIFALVSIVVLGLLYATCTTGWCTFCCTKPAGSQDETNMGLV